MSLKPLPRSKARTAYGLVGDVIKAILAEPRRVSMAVFIDDAPPQLGGPACGTVGCFAGWVNVLAGRSVENIKADMWPDDRARSILGRDCNYWIAGRDGDCDVFDSGFSGDIVGRTGTPAYARSVVKRIEKFRRINAKALRAKKLS